ncbi:MAG: hypothetical protein COB67_02650 [SAR324 cluster bacterium]|uniref:Uncharacterized protein n=1 Tax=SAR324 cluster bacterium TaxID=2024889 RepID=A0A2A4TAP9_9DELT|nr:MAG: hypothetical protein COB67_02650 [SAR324 cluster bacterium]
MLVFKEKDCPFCDGLTDDRDNTFEKKCDHSFTEIEYNATIMGVNDLEKQLKENKRTVRRMKKIIEENKRK